ncbi:hypothetical protein G6F32_016312 [Rhizopus arrhizus]|nr:hypothetical protein G6F32_016312 [Rhizopus arrhizus]
MATPVVAHRALQVLRQRLELLPQLFDRQVSVLGAFQRRVDVVDVGLVMLGVMDFHRRRIDMRFQRVVGVGQLGQGVGHDASPDCEGTRRCRAVRGE